MRWERSMRERGMWLVWLVWSVCVRCSVAVEVAVRTCVPKVPSISPMAIFEGINEARDWRAVLRRSLSIETSEMLFTSSSLSISFLGSTCCTGDTFSGYECGHRTAASH